MVRSKDVPKKPKDPLLTPPSKLRGAGFLDEGRPSNRGGAAMSPAPASVPNFMRAISSSDAKGGRHRARVAATAVPASASPARRRAAAVRVVTRGRVLFPEAPGSGPGLGRATCSSTLKGAKFPDALNLAPGATHAEGPAAMRVCPYTYCSLNGHAHTPAVPLRSFLASRRRLIKTQQSMKLKGVSAFRKKSEDKNGTSAGGAAAAKVAPLINEEAVGDFFVEVYTGPRVSSDMSCSDMSLDEMDAMVRKMEFVVFDRCGADEDSEKGKDLVFCGDGERDGRLEEKHGACKDSSSVCSDAVISGDFIEELPWMMYHGSEYDSLDDGISEEQRVREDEIDGAQISEEQEGNGNARSSGRLGDECEQKAAKEHEADDEENISNSGLESENAQEQEGVACGVEACHELNRRDEDTILDALCHGEPSAGQAAEEEKFSVAVDESEIADHKVAGRVDNSILEEGCIEETSADQEAKDDGSSVKSDGGSEVTSDDGSEMEISEDTISNDGCREDFSDEVTSEAILTEDIFDDSLADESLVNDVFEQDSSPENAQSNAQKELGITTSEIENASEGSDVVYNIVDSMKDAPKEMRVITCEESGAANDSNQEIISCFDDGAQMEPKITTCMPKDASVESDVSQGSSLDGNAEYVADGAMGLEITRCKLEDAYEETGIDQEAVEDDDFVRVRDDAQNDDSGMIECKLGDASKASFTTQESEQSDNSETVSSDAENESNHNTSELALGISEDIETEPKLTTCKPEDVSEESGISQESDHDGCSAYITDGTQNESEFTTFESEGAQEDTDAVKEDEGKGNSADSQKKPENTWELGGASERPAMSQEAGIDQENIEDDDFVHVRDDAQNDDSRMTECKLGDASNDSFTTQESEQRDNSANVSSDAQNESNHTISELILGISEDTETESKLTTCEPKDVSEEYGISQESDHDGCSAYITDGTQNESEFMTFESEGAQEDSDAIKEDEGKGNSADSQKKLEKTTYESGGASESPAMSQEADGHVNSEDLSYSAQKDIIPKLDASEDIQTAEESNQLFNVEIPEHKYDLTAGGHEPQSIATEVNDTKEPSVDDICDAFGGMNLKGDVYFDTDESPTCPRNKLIISRRRRTPEEEEYMRGFNPRAPNFLPLELDPDAEKVDLRHQMVDERKNAEEWMIDYALRRALTNLAPARKKKVELLVQAFETVLPHDEDDKKSMTPPRPVQACN